MAGCRLTVRVTPKAGRDAVEIAEDGEIRVRVRAQPKEGEANEAVCRMMAKALGLPASWVTVAAGHASRTKFLAIEGLEREEAMKRLRQGPGRTQDGTVKP